LRDVRSARSAHQAAAVTFAGVGQQLAAGAEEHGDEDLAATFLGAAR